MAELKDQEVEVIVKVKFVTDISLWNALKLRLAGGEVIKELIDIEVKEVNKGETDEP